MHYFSDINISQGSVATYLRYGGILVLVLLQISQRLCASESFFFTNGQYLMKTWHMDKCMVSRFLTHGLIMGHMKQSNEALSYTCSLDI